MAKKKSKKPSIKLPIIPKRKMIKVRPSVISELYQMEPNLLKKGWKKGKELDEGSNIIIPFTKGKNKKFVITCEPLHITWRKFEENKEGEMIRKTLVLGVIHYDIEKLEYLNYI